MSFFRSFKYALSGIIYCVLCERNMRIHTVVSLYVLFFARFYDFSYVHYILIILTIASVMSAEMINTAFEKLCNKISQQKNFTIKIVKDIAAGAVLINAIAAFIIGVVLFFQVDKIFLICEYFFHSWVHSILFAFSLICSFAFIVRTKYRKEKFENFLYFVFSREFVESEKHHKKELENFLKAREENFEKD